MTTDAMPLAGQAEIPLGRILVSGENPREHFDEEALAELVRSIEKDGLLQAILVRPIPSDEEWPTLQAAKRAGRLPEGWEEAPELEGSLYELVSGERRLRAHQELGEDTIRAEIRPMSRETAVRLRLIENVQREDLGEVEEAAAYQRMIDELDYDVEAIAEEVGKSISYVYQRLKLLELADPVRKALVREEITAGHAIEIARLPTPELQKRALEAALNQYRQGGELRTVAMSVRDLRDWIRQFAHLELDHAPWAMDDEKLLPQAGPCTTCPKRTGNAAGLWEEVEDGATCTDPDCYQVKMENFLEQAAAELEKEETPFVRVATKRGRIGRFNIEREGSYYTSDTIGSFGWTRADGPDACDHTQVGLRMDGAEIGRTIHVCTKAGCDVHDPRDEEEAGEQDRRSRLHHQRNLNERQRRTSEVNRRLALALLEDDELAPETRLQIAFARLWDESWRKDQEAASEMLGMKDAEPATAAKWSDGRSVGELADAFFTLALARHLGGRSTAAIPNGYGVRNLAPALTGTTIDEAKVRIREEASWRLPEDLFDLEFVLPARVDFDQPDGFHDYHLRRAGEDVFCGEGPEEERVSEEEPDHWRWDRCERCWDRMLDLQTSALEEDDDE